MQSFIKVHPIKVHTGGRPLTAASVLRRSVEIIFFVALHGGRFVLLSTRRLLVKRGPAQGATFGNCLAGLFESLGPTFIKIGQVLSSRPDLLPREVINGLTRLQDQIAPFDVQLIPGLIESAFGRSIDEIFESFDFNPVSAASVAHVHRARLKDGRQVAVKIRRPGVIRQVDNDLRILRFVARTLALLPFMRTTPVRQLVDEVGFPVRQQLDFRLEAENNRRFRRNFVAVEHVKFPALIEPLCADSVLTMEFVEEMQKLTSQCFTADERKTAALAGLRALYKMIFLDRLVHADMHPGNIFIRRWGELVILDTGLVAQLGESDLDDFVDFFFGLINNDSKECARIVYDTAICRSRSCDRQAFEVAMAKLISKHSRMKSHEFQITQFVYQLISTQRRFGICGSTKFMMIILSMLVFDGICKQLYPDCDFQAEARAFLIAAKYRRRPVSNHLQEGLNPDVATRERDSLTLHCGGGSHSSTLFPSGSINQPNLP